MKKRFILLGFIAFMMQSSALQLMGQETATWVAADLNYANGTTVTDAFTIGDYVQCQFSKGLGSNSPAYYTNHVRLYAKNTITIGPLNGSSISITKVELTCKKGNKTYLQIASVTPDNTGEWVDPVPTNTTDTVVTVWEGDMKSDLVFTMANSGQRYVYKIKVTYTDPSSTVYHVTYKPNGGVGNDIVVNNVGNTITVMDNPFDYDEMVFDRWNSEADGQGDDYFPGLEYDLIDDLTLYAQWMTSPDLLVDVLNPTIVNAAIGANLGYSVWTINLPDSEHPRITYQGKSAKSANNIQMNSSISGLSAYSGIATTFTHNLKAKKVKVTWDGSTSDGSALDVYGKDTPYSGPSDLYGDTQGDLLGSIVKGTSTELDITALNGIYPYIGLRSNSGAIYLAEIRIIWETYDVTAPVVRIEPTSVELGNVVVGNPLNVDFTVSQANLEDDITLQANYGTFSIEGTTVTTIPAGAEPTVVTWNYTPTTEGPLEVNVTASSGSVSGYLTIDAQVLSTNAQTLHESKAAFVANSSQNSACINLADVEVIAQSNNYLYLQDAETGLLVYGGGAPTLQTPCKFTSGYLEGTFVNYHGIIELQNFQFVNAETTQDMQLTTITATVDEILASPSTYDSRYVQLNNVYISSWTLTGNNGTLAFHDRFNTGYTSKTAPETTDPFTVKALLNGYYASGATNYQIDPIALTDIHTNVKAAQPSVSPSGTASNPSQATTVVLGPLATTQAHQVYYYKINDGAFISFTAWTYVNLFDAQTTLTAYGTRDFYENSNEKVSYYVQPQNTYTVRFSINGVINASNNVLVNGQLQASQTPDVSCYGDFGFAGWSLSESSTEAITLPYDVTDNITLYAVYAEGSEFVYKKVTRAAEIVDGEYIVFAEGNRDKFTIKNVSSTHSPTAYSMTDLGISISNQGTLVGGDLSELTWSFRGNASELQITSTANETNHLYIIGNSSTGVRVGHTSDNTSWSINEDQSVVEQFNMMSNGRYMVEYNDQDWRSYTSLNNQNSYPRLLLFRKQAVVDENTPRYTRVFWNETATGSINLVGPSIVPSGYYLDMADNNMTNGNASNFIIEDNASFKVAHGNTEIMATVKKDIAGYVYDTARIGWHLLSSPVGAFSTQDERVPRGLLAGDYDLYAFDQSQADEWQNAEYNGGTNITVAEQGGVLYANKLGTTIVFVGELTATVQYKDLTYVPGMRFSGWNIVGNPYTSAGYLTIQYEGEGMAISDYYRMRDISENGKKFSKLIVTSIDTPIDPMEGVFVQAPAEGYQYRFVNTNRGLNVIQSEYMNIKVSGNDGEVMDMARVRFNEGCLMGKFDFGEGGSQLYIPQGGKKYAVVPTQGHGELPINFKAAQNGTYTMDFDLENAEMDYLHLIDNKTGVDVDLLQTPTYTFDATRDDYYSRFRLLFEANGALGDDNFAYYDGSVWMVTGSYDNATVQVIDMMGRVLSSQTVNGSAELSIKHAQGVYVLRLINNNEIKTQKIIVR